MNEKYKTFNTTVNIYPPSILSKKTTFCESSYEIQEIKLTRKDQKNIEKQVSIKNDSLITFITQQICKIEDVSWSTGTRGEGAIIEIQLLPKKNKENLYVVYRGLSFKDNRFHEGTTYFKNDLLCEMIFKLTQTPYNEN